MRMSFSQENNNCAGTAFVQGDSVDGSKLTEQTILVNPKPDHLPGRGFARSRDHCPGLGFSFSFLCRGGGGGVSGFRIREIFYSFGRKMYEALDLFQRNWKPLENRVLLCCFMPIFAKAVDDYCIFNNIDHLRQFRSLSGHPRSIC